MLEEEGPSLPPPPKGDTLLKRFKSEKSKTIQKHLLSAAAAVHSPLVTRVLQGMATLLTDYTAQMAELEKEELRRAYNADPVESDGNYSLDHMDDEKAFTEELLRGLGVNPAIALLSDKDSCDQTAQELADLINNGGMSDAAQIESIADRFLDSHGAKLLSPVKQRLNEMETADSPSLMPPPSTTPLRKRRKQAHPTKKNVEPDPQPNTETIDVEDIDIDSFLDDLHG